MFWAKWKLYRSLSWKSSNLLRETRNSGGLCNEKRRHSTFYLDYRKINLATVGHLLSILRLEESIEAFLPWEAMHSSCLTQWKGLLENKYWQATTSSHRWYLTILNHLDRKVFRVYSIIQGTSLLSTVQRRFALVYVDELVVLLKNTEQRTGTMRHVWRLL